VVIINATAIIINRFAGQTYLMAEGIFIISEAIFTFLVL